MNTNTCEDCRARPSEAWALALLLGASSLWAQTPEPSPPPAAEKSRFEGAIGLVSRYAPAYVGSSEQLLETRLGGYVRWGRLTINGRGGFVARRADEATTGADYELVRSDQWRVSVSARMVSGRPESRTTQLAGMGDIEETLRLRLGGTLALNKAWSLRLGASTDVAGNGLGTLFELGVAREWVWSSSSRLVAGAGISAGDKKYMQAWHGVSAAQALRSGYAVYAPGFGARELSTGLTWRKELGSEDGGLVGGRWALYLGGSAGRLLGSAANSPLTRNAGTWQVSGGIARRF